MVTTKVKHNYTELESNIKWNFNILFLYLNFQKYIYL